MNSYHSVFPHCRFKVMKSFDCRVEPPKPGANISLLYMNDTRCFIILMQNWTKHSLRASPSAAAKAPACLCSATLYLFKTKIHVSWHLRKPVTTANNSQLIPFSYPEQTNMTYSQQIHPRSPTWPEPLLCIGGTKREKSLGLAFTLPKIMLYIIFYYCSRDQLQNNLAIGKHLSDSGKTKGGNISIS